MQFVQETIDAQPSIIHRSDMAGVNLLLLVALELGVARNLLKSKKEAVGQTIAKKEFLRRKRLMFCRSHLP